MSRKTAVSIRKEDGQENVGIVPSSPESSSPIDNHTIQQETNAATDNNERPANRWRWRNWTLITFESLPHWLQDNEFLRTRHRPQIKSVVDCFKSIFSLHSETGNIWTHLLGCIAFIILAGWFLARPGSALMVEEKVVFSFFFVGAILCLGLSFTFHTLHCHSHPVSKVFQKLDYVGIALLIIGSFIPWIYYVFYCRMAPKCSYISMIVALGIFAIIVSLCDKFAENRYRPLRAIVFVIMGLSAMVPVFHFLITDGFASLVNEGGFYWLITMASLYLLGALIYAIRMPERFFPGWFDLWFQSHQIFHMFVVNAAIIHYIGITQMVQMRMENPCPHSSSLNSSTSLTTTIAAS